jgi:hypothetical protein
LAAALVAAELEDAAQKKINQGGISGDNVSPASAVTVELQQQLVAFAHVGAYSRGRIIAAERVVIKRMGKT